VRGRPERGERGRRGQVGGGPHGIGPRDNTLAAAPDRCARGGDGGPAAEAVGGVGAAARGSYAPMAARATAAAVAVAVAARRWGGGE
jgi:hypothetical protein